MNSDAPLGMHHEFSQNIEMEMLGDCLENQSSEAENLPLSTGNENSKSKQTLFESFKVCGDFVSKCEKSMSASMRNYVEHQLNDLMAKTIANSMGNFEPDSEGSGEDFKNSEPINEKSETCGEKNDSHHYVSMLPATDRRSKDKRLKQGWEC